MSASGKTYDVFISYRRQGGAVKAELTKDELIKRGFRGSRIFLDTHSLSTGNYIDTILEALHNSKNVVVVITKGCFDNLQDSSTWIREISYALEQGVNIVPIYYDGISQVSPAQLPEGIKRLSLEHAVIYVHEYSEASFDRLASRLSKEPLSVPKWSKWVLGAVAAGGVAYGGYTAVENSTPAEAGEVYIVNSNTSKSYHKTKKCITLRNATHKIKKVTEEEAIMQGRKPCKKCYKD